MSKFQRHNEEPLEDWLLSYADLITLLMAFFVLLVSVSKIDSSLYERVQSGIAKDVGNRQAERPIETMQKELAHVISGKQGDNIVEVGTDERGVVLNMDAGLMFNQGSAELKLEILPVMEEITKTLSQERFRNYRVEIQGHTDDSPMPKNSPFPSSFEMAAARALATLRSFKSFGMEEERMLIASYGQYRPRVPNTREDGTPLPINQSINRRVSVHIYPY